MRGTFSCLDESDQGVGCVRECESGIDGSEEFVCVKRVEIVKKRRRQ